MSLRAALVVLAGIGTLAVAPAESWASCDGCCDLRATLAGWSADGRQWAVVYGHDGSEEELVLHGPGGERRWSAYEPVDGEEPMCVAATPRLPGRAGRDADLIDVGRWRPFRAYRLAATRGAWRVAFDAAVQVVPVGRRTFRTDPFRLGLRADHVCTAWELRDTAGRVLATLPRSCDDAEPLGTLDVLGGYLHPDAGVALVKVSIHRVRLVSDQHYLRIELRPGASGAVAPTDAHDAPRAPMVQAR